MAKSKKQKIKKKTRPIQKDFKRRFKKKKSVLRNKFFWYGLLGLGAASALAYFLLFSSFFQIKEAAMQGLEDSPEMTAGIEKVIKAELNKKYLAVFRADCFFLLKTKKIKEIILNDWPLLKDVYLKKQLPNKLQVILEKRPEKAIWCFDQAEKCFLIDEAGIIFEQVSLKLIGSNLSDKLVIFYQPAGETSLLAQVLPVEQIEQIWLLERILKDDLSLELANFTLPSSDRLTVKLTSGLEIYFLFNDDISLALTKLKVFLEEGVSLEELKNLKYIDLRFSKLYYQ